MSQTLTLDDFLSPVGEAPISVAPGSSASKRVNNPGAIGGGRHVFLTNNYSGSLLSDIKFFNTPVISSQSGRNLGITLNTPAAGNVTDDVDWSFIYGANPALPATDITMYQNITLLWQADHLAHQNDSSIELRLFDQSGNTHGVKYTWSTRINNPNLTTRWDLDEFANAGVNLSQITRFDLLGNSDSSADIGFTSFFATTVPEPSSLVLGLATSSFFLLRRNRGR